MAVGDRIKRVRNCRKMTMKELGMAVGFDKKSADVHIAQRLDVNHSALAEPATYCAENIFALFELEAQGCSHHLPNGIDNIEEGLHYNRVAVCFNYNTLDSFVKEWNIRKDELMAGAIDKDEYIE